MSAPISARDAQTWIEEALALQANIGFAKSVANIVLADLNPFDLKAPRKPRTMFLIVALLFAAAAITFWYFNLAGWRMWSDVLSCGG